MTKKKIDSEKAFLLAVIWLLIFFFLIYDKTPILVQWAFFLGPLIWAAHEYK